MYELKRKEGRARRGTFSTVHGTVQTPAFMNVATCGAIRGAVSALDLKELKCQVQLCNTYHLRLRPGAWRNPEVYPMGGPCSNRQRRLSGVFLGFFAKY